VSVMTKYKIWQKIKESQKGASMIEIVVSIGIIVVVFSGLLQVFIYSSVLSDMAGNITFAVTEAESQLEKIRGHDFDSITTDYGSSGTPGNTFPLSFLNGIGAIYITAVHSDLLEVEIVVSWQEKDNRIMGEDTNLDGDLDAGEDANGNGRLDSIATITSYVANRN